VDVYDLDQVKRLIAGIKDEYGRLDGVLHCAGTIADNFILKKTGCEFREALAPKVTGTYNLDQTTRDVELDFFALFSSIAGAMGNVGQADYATANGFMDGFAAYRNRLAAAGERRGRTLSIIWPLWQEGGMGIDAASLELLEQTTGLLPMRTATGMDAFYRSLARRHTTRFWSRKAPSRGYGAHCSTVPRRHWNRGRNNRRLPPRSILGVLRRRRKTTCGSSFRDC
jgi:NAD(P)-dependent dehydrogenase (short-subunit alcohol dehydrogenase family)